VTAAFIKYSPTSIKLNNMSVWYWKDSADQENGPLGPDKILMLIRNGEIQRTTPIRKDNSPWVPASQVNGLWETAAKPYKIYNCVECDTQIDRPPTRCPKCARRVEKATEKTITPDLTKVKPKTASAGVAPKAIIAKLRDRLLPKPRNDQ
jgi:DNA-directed RNA polymerase subunit RPC12/RpoP